MLAEQRAGPRHAIRENFMRIVGDYIHSRFFSQAHPLRIEKYGHLNEEDVIYYAGMMVNPDHIKRFQKTPKHRR